MNRHIICLVLALSIAGTESVSGAGQDAEREPTRLSLKECTKRALANSQALQAERHRLDALYAQVNQVFWAPFSNISINALTSVVTDKCVDPQYQGLTGADSVCRGGGSTGDEDDIDWSGGWGPTFQLMIKSGVPIYTFGKIHNAKEVVEQAYAAKKAEFPKLEHRIRFQVSQAYQAISGAREMLYTIGEGRKYLKKAREKVESDLESQEGTSTEIDLIKLNVLDSEVDTYEVQAHEIERVGLAALRFLVGGPNKNRVDILDEPQERLGDELKTLETYKDTAIERRPELKAIKHAMRALEAKVEMRRSDFWPDLALVAWFNVARTPGRPDLNSWLFMDRYNYGPSLPGVALTLSYKLDLGLDVYRLDEAKAELAALATDQKTALDGIMLDVEKTYHNAAAARNGLLAMERSKRLVKGWITAVMQNHATGLSSANEVKDALKEYFQIMAAIHKLTHDFNVGIAALDRATGAQGRAG